VTIKASLTTRVKDESELKASHTWQPAMPPGATPSATVAQQHAQPLGGHPRRSSAECSRHLLTGSGSSFSSITSQSSAGVPGWQL
jgi:hypothetical protein